MPFMQPRASQPVDAARIAREREIHLTKLAAAERRRPSTSGLTSTTRAGAGPSRPWAEPPASMPRPPFVGARGLPPVSRAPAAGVAPRARSAAPRTLSRPADFAYQEHQRNVKALHQKLCKVAAGVEWRQREHQENAQAAGRAQHTTRGNRRRDQRALATVNAEHMRRLRKMPARFASPEEIALLTGKPLQGGGGGGGEEGGGGDEED